MAWIFYRVKCLVNTRMCTLFCFKKEKRIEQISYYGNLCILYRKTTSENNLHERVIYSFMFIKLINNKYMSIVDNAIKRIYQN